MTQLGENEMILGPHLLGRTLEHDPASRNYEHPVRRLTRPRNVTHTLNAPTMDQGQVGSCEGNTAAEFLNCAKAVRNRIAYNKADDSRFDGRSYLDQIDAVDLYSVATLLDNDHIPGIYPPTDTGTSGVGIAKAVRNAGGLERYEWTFTWEAFLATLQRQPVMLGTHWYQSMFETDSKGYVVPPRPGDQPVGGHAYLGFKFDWINQRAGCTNHWTEDWGIRIAGHGGRFWISFDLLEQLLIHEQGDSLVPVLL